MDICWACRNGVTQSRRSSLGFAEFSPYSLQRSLVIALFWNQTFFKKTIVDLQCCASFHCIAKWFNFTYTYVLIIKYFFYCSLSQEAGYSFLCCTVGPYCLSIQNVIAYLYLPTPNYQSISLPPLSPLASTSLISTNSLWVCFYFVDRFICAIF